MTSLPAGTDPVIPVVDLPQISDEAWQLAASLQALGRDPWADDSRPLSFDAALARYSREASIIFGSFRDGLITEVDGHRLLDHMGQS